MVICVYCSSSNHIDDKYFHHAYHLGTAIAKRKDTLLNGGGQVGLMGECAKGALEHGGEVIGVIPKALNQEGIVHEGCTKMIITEGMRERKAKMDEYSDAFIAMPGGYGTLEELLEIITLKQLKYHNKPIVIYNVDGFYTHLLDMFDMIIQENFAKELSKTLYHVCENEKEVMEYIDGYQPIVYEDKWWRK